jgi:hypothetical protein
VLGIIESFDCKPDHPEGNGTTDLINRRDPVDSQTEKLPPCFVQPPSIWTGRGQPNERYPNVNRNEAPLINAPFRLTPPQMPPGIIPSR